MSRRRQQIESRNGSFQDISDRGAACFDTCRANKYTPPIPLPNRARHNDAIDRYLRLTSPSDKRRKRHPPLVDQLLQSSPDLPIKLFRLVDNKQRYPHLINTSMTSQSPPSSALPASYSPPPTPRISHQQQQQSRDQPSAASPNLMPTCPSSTGRPAPSQHTLLPVLPVTSPPHSLAAAPQTSTIFSEHPSLLSRPNLVDKNRIQQLGQHHVNVQPQQASSYFQAYGAAYSLPEVQSHLSPPAYSRSAMLVSNPITTVITQSHLRPIMEGHSTTYDDKLQQSETFRPVNNCYSQPVTSRSLLRVDRSVETDIEDLKPLPTSHSVGTCTSPHLINALKPPADSAGEHPRNLPHPRSPDNSTSSVTNVPDVSTSLANASGSSETAKVFSVKKTSNAPVQNASALNSPASNQMAASSPMQSPHQMTYSNGLTSSLGRTEASHSRTTELASLLTSSAGTGIVSSSSRPLRSRRRRRSPQPLRFSTQPASVVELHGSQQRDHFANSEHQSAEINPSYSADIPHASNCAQSLQTAEVPTSYPSNPQIPQRPTQPANNHQYLSQVTATSSQPASSGMSVSKQLQHLNSQSAISADMTLCPHQEQTSNSTCSQQPPQPSASPLESDFATQRLRSKSHTQYSPTICQQEPSCPCLQPPDPRSDTINRSRLPQGETSLPFRPNEDGQVQPPMMAKSTGDLSNILQHCNVAFNTNHELAGADSDLSYHTPMYSMSGNELPSQSATQEHRGFLASYSHVQSSHLSPPVGLNSGRQNAIGSGNSAPLGPPSKSHQYDNAACSLAASHSSNQTTDGRRDGMRQDKAQQQLGRPHCMATRPFVYAEETSPKTMSGNLSPAPSCGQNINSQSQSVTQVYQEPLRPKKSSGGTIAPAMNVSTMKPAPLSVRASGAAERRPGLDYSAPKMRLESAAHNEGQSEISVRRVASDGCSQPLRTENRWGAKECRRGEGNLQDNHVNLIQEAASGRAATYHRTRDIRNDPFYGESNDLRSTRQYTSEIVQNPSWLSQLHSSTQSQIFDQQWKETPTMRAMLDGTYITGNKDDSTRHLRQPTQDGIGATRPIHPTGSLQTHLLPAVDPTRGSCSPEPSARQNALRWVVDSRRRDVDGPPPPPQRTADLQQDPQQSHQNQNFAETTSRAFRHTKHGTESPQLTNNGGLADRFTSGPINDRDFQQSPGRQERPEVSATRAADHGLLSPMRYAQVRNENQMRANLEAPSVRGAYASDESPTMVSLRQDLKVPTFLQILLDNAEKIRDRQPSGSRYTDIPTSADFETTRYLLPTERYSNRIPYPGSTVAPSAKLCDGKQVTGGMQREVGHLSSPSVGYINPTGMVNASETFRNEKEQMSRNICSSHAVHPTAQRTYGFVDDFRQGDRLATAWTTGGMASLLTSPSESHRPPLNEEASNIRRCEIPRSRPYSSFAGFLSLPLQDNPPLTTAGRESVQKAASAFVTSDFQGSDESTHHYPNRHAPAWLPPHLDRLVGEIIPSGMPLTDARFMAAQQSSNLIYGQVSPTGSERQSHSTPVTRQLSPSVAPCHGNLLLARRQLTSSSVLRDLNPSIAPRRELSPTSDVQDVSPAFMKQSMRPISTRAFVDQASIHSEGAKARPSWLPIPNRLGDSRNGNAPMTDSISCHLYSKHQSRPIENHLPALSGTRGLSVEQLESVKPSAAMLRRTDSGADQRIRDFAMLESLGAPSPFIGRTDAAEFTGSSATKAWSPKDNLNVESEAHFLSVSRQAPTVAVQRIPSAPAALGHPWTSSTLHSSDDIGDRLPTEPRQALPTREDSSDMFHALTQFEVPPHSTRAATSVGNPMDRFQIKYGLDGNLNSQSYAALPTPLQMRYLHSHANAPNHCPGATHNKFASVQQQPWSPFEEQRYLQESLVDNYGQKSEGASPSLSSHRQDLNGLYRRPQHFRSYPLESIKSITSTDLEEESSSGNLSPHGQWQDRATADFLSDELQSAKPSYPAGDLVLGRHSRVNTSPSRVQSCYVDIVAPDLIRDVCRRRLPLFNDLPSPGDLTHYLLGEIDEPVVALHNVVTDETVAVSSSGMSLRKPRKANGMREDPAGGHVALATPPFPSYSSSETDSDNESQEAEAKRVMNDAHDSNDFERMRKEDVAKAESHNSKCGTQSPASKGPSRTAVRVPPLKLPLLNHRLKIRPSPKGTEDDNRTALSLGASIGSNRLNQLCASSDRVTLSPCRLSQSLRDSNLLQSVLVDFLPSEDCETLISPLTISSMDCMNMQHDDSQGINEAASSRVTLPSSASQATKESPFDQIAFDDSVDKCTPVETPSSPSATSPKLLTADPYKSFTQLPSYNPIDFQSHLKFEQSKEATNNGSRDTNGLLTTGSNIVKHSNLSSTSSLASTEVPTPSRQSPPPVQLPPANVKNLDLLSQTKPSSTSKLTSSNLSLLKLAAPKVLAAKVPVATSSSSPASQACPPPLFRSVDEYLDAEFWSGNGKASCRKTGDSAVNVGKEILAKIQRELAEQNSNERIDIHDADRASDSRSTGKQLIHQSTAKRGDDFPPEERQAGELEQLRTSDTTATSPNDDNPLTADRTSIPLSPDPLRELALISDVRGAGGTGKVSTSKLAGKHLPVDPSKLDAGGGSSVERSSVESVDKAQSNSGDMELGRSESESSQNNTRTEKATRGFGQNSSSSLLCSSGESGNADPSENSSNDIKSEERMTTSTSDASDPSPLNRTDVSEDVGLNISAARKERNPEAEAERKESLGVRSVRSKSDSTWSSRSSQAVSKSVVSAALKGSRAVIGITDISETEEESGEVDETETLLGIVSSGRLNTKKIGLLLSVLSSSSSNSMDLEVMKAFEDAGKSLKHIRANSDPVVASRNASPNLDSSGCNTDGNDEVEARATARLRAAVNNLKLRGECSEEGGTNEGINDDTPRSLRTPRSAARVFTRESLAGSELSSSPEITFNKAFSLSDGTDNSRCIAPAHVVLLDADDTLIPTTELCEEKYLDRDLEQLPMAFRKNLHSLDVQLTRLFEQLHTLVVLEDSGKRLSDWGLAERLRLGVNLERNYILSVVIVTNATLSHIQSTFEKFLPRLSLFFRSRDIRVEELVCSARDIWADEFPFEHFYEFWKAWTLEDILRDLKLDGVPNVTVLSVGDDEPERKAAAYVEVEMEGFVKSVKVLKMMTQPKIQDLIVQLNHINDRFRFYLECQTPFDLKLELADSKIIESVQPSPPEIPDRVEASFIQFELKYETLFDAFRMMSQTDVLHFASELKALRNRQIVSLSEFVLECKRFLTIYKTNGGDEGKAINIPTLAVLMEDFPQDTPSAKGQDELPDSATIINALQSVVKFLLQYPNLVSTLPNYGWHPPSNADFIVSAIGLFLAALDGDDFDSITPFSRPPHPQRIATIKHEATHTQAFFS